MLKWKKDYLTGEGIDDPEKIKNKLDAGKYVYGIYLLTLSDNPSNLFEIIPAAMLLQKSYYRICPEIIGMAKGKDEALEMVRSLLAGNLLDQSSLPSRSRITRVRRRS